jgi:hypothetical protein
LIDDAQQIGKVDLRAEIGQRPAMLENSVLGFDIPS